MSKQANPLDSIPRVSGASAFEKSRFNAKPKAGTALKEKDARVAAAQLDREEAKRMTVKKPAIEEEGEVVGEKMRADVMIRDGLKCVLCPARRNLEVHHITPRSQGGKAVEENLCTLCRKCNNGIGGRRLELLRAIGHAINPDALQVVDEPPPPKPPETPEARAWRESKAAECRKRLASVTKPKPIPPPAPPPEDL